MALTVVLAGCGPKAADATPTAPAGLAAGNGASAAAKGGDIAVNPSGNFNVPRRK